MSTSADIPDLEDVARFLRRFSDLMSTGQNAEYLLRAATLLEFLIGRVTDLERLHREETERAETQVAFYNTLEARSDDLESEADELKADIARLQARLNEAAAAAAADELKFASQTEQAGTRLAMLERELMETRAHLATVGDTHVLVPVTVLRQAQTQFEALSRQAGDVVSQVMCEVGASTLDRAIDESSIQQPGSLASLAML